MNEYFPDRWLIIKIDNEDTSESIYKLFATWSGGYLDGDCWRLNSGITRVEQEDDFFIFYGHSGSSYRCSKNRYSYGSTSYGYSVLENAISKSTCKITVLDSFDEKMIDNLVRIA